MFLGATSTLFKNTCKHGVTTITDATCNFFSSCCLLPEQRDQFLALTIAFQVAGESEAVPPVPPFLQAKHHQFPQPLLIRFIASVPQSLSFTGLVLQYHCT